MWMKRITQQSQLSTVAIIITLHKVFIWHCSWSLEIPYILKAVKEWLVFMKISSEIDPILDNVFIWKLSSKTCNWDLV